MYVCICQQVTDRDIREYCESNNANLSQMRKDLGQADHERDHDPDHAVRC